jgi:hypothetical protein
MIRRKGRLVLTKIKVLLFKITIVMERIIMGEETKKGDQAPKKTAPLIIPLIKVPNEAELMEEELEEIYNQDKVTHKHGEAEPEAD